MSNSPSASSIPPTIRPAFAATIGLDWADQRHAICIRHHDTGQREVITLAHQPAELEAWITQLRSRHHGRRVALAVEHGRSAVLYALLEHQDFITLFPVPPQAIHAYRQAVRTTSGAKSDLADAELIEDYLHRHGDALRSWCQQDDTTRLLQGLTERRRHLVDERTRLTNAMLAEIKLAYPVVTAIFDQLGSPAALAFLRRWPTLPSLLKASRQTLRKFFIAQHWRNNKSLEEKLDLIAAARPLVTDAVILQLAHTGIQNCAARLRALLPLIDSLQEQISTAYARHPSSAIFDTLPGAGPALAPRLAALFGTDKERWPDARSLQVFTGIAPCTQQSGKTRVVSKRWACPDFLRQTLHEFARLSTVKCAWAKAHVETQRQRGKSYHTAVRSLAFKWLRILWRMWHDHLPYCEATFTAAQKHRGLHA